MKHYNVDGFVGNVDSLTADLLTKTLDNLAIVLQGGPSDLPEPAGGVQADEV